MLEHLDRDGDPPKPSCTADTLEAAGADADKAGTGNVGDAVSSCPANAQNLLGMGVFRKRIKSIQVTKLTFQHDHQMMTDNNSDWQNSGSRFSKPEWTSGKTSSPISHTKNLNVEVEVEFEVQPSNAEATDADITGTADSALGSLVFTGKKVFRGGTVTVSCKSNGPLPDRVDKLTGDIDWNINTDADGQFPAGKSVGHTIYVTMGDPISVGGREAGITLKRMDKAVQLVKGTGKAIPPWADAPKAIVTSLMGLLPDYELHPNPTVNGARPGVDHPQFFNTIGGAWNIADFISARAECQATVRFLRAVIKQVGCPGDALIMVVYADPDVNNGNTVLEDNFEAAPDPDPAGRPNPGKKLGLHRVPDRTINGRPGCVISLLGSPRDASDAPMAIKIKPGMVFDTEKKGLSLPKIPGIGDNAYEACLKFTDPNGSTDYYPGGSVGAMHTKEDVITVFQALAWMSAAPGGKPTENLLKVEKIVKAYH